MGDRKVSCTGLRLVLAVVGIVLLVEIPYALAYSQSARDLVFTGMFWSPHDFAQYAAAMREGAGSASWQIHNHLTGEPHEPAFIYVFYVALGKAAALAGIDFQIAYHVAEIAARAVLLISLYQFYRIVLKDGKKVWLAFVLAVLSGGFGFLRVVVNTAGFSSAGTVRSAPADFNLPEVNNFITFFTAPHLMLGLALLLFASRCYLAAWTDPNNFNVFAVGVATVGIGLSNPFSLVTLWGWLLAHLFVALVLKHRIPARVVQAIFLALIGSLPFVAYNFLVFKLDPFWGLAYGAQNVLPSPSVFNFVVGYGGLLVLAAIGLRAFWGHLTLQRSFVLAALVASLVLMYLPIEYQRRFAFGVSPLLATVAAVGLERFWQWFGSKPGPLVRTGRLVTTSFLVSVVLLTNALLYFSMVRTASGYSGDERRWPTLQPKYVVDATRWLSANARDDDVVLAGLPTSNLIAQWGTVRVFVGHPIATLNFDFKLREAERFFAGDGSPSERKEFLLRNHIRYVFYGPLERTHGSDWLAAADYLSMVYDDRDVRIFVFVPGESARQMPDLDHLAMVTGVEP